MTSVAPHSSPLNAFAAATVCEARGLPYALSPTIKPIHNEWSVGGPARTVLTASGNLWIHRAIYAAEPGDVLVVSGSGPVSRRWTSMA